jgi:hypothetical protein
VWGLCSKMRGPLNVVVIPPRDREDWSIRTVGAFLDGLPEEWLTKSELLQPVSRRDGSTSGSSMGTSVWRLKLFIIQFIPFLALDSRARLARTKCRRPMNDRKKSTYGLLRLKPREGSARERKSNGFAAVRGFRCGETRQLSQI